jgi:hypothetical protein
MPLCTLLLCSPTPLPFSGSEALFIMWHSPKMALAVILFLMGGLSLVFVVHFLRPLPLAFAYSCVESLLFLWN